MPKKMKIWCVQCPKCNKFYSNGEYAKIKVCPFCELKELKETYAESVDFKVQLAKKYSELTKINHGLNAENATLQSMVYNQQEAIRIGDREETELRKEVATVRGENSGLQTAIEVMTNSMLDEGE